MGAQYPTLAAAGAVRVGVPGRGLSAIRTRGHWQALAALGGAGLVLSLWLHWYTGHVSQAAWQSFTATPAVLLAIAIVGGDLSTLELARRVGDTSRLTILAGGLAAALVAYRIAVPPGPGSVHPAWGAYVSLVCALAMLSGGVVSALDEAPAPELPRPAVTSA